MIPDFLAKEISSHVSRVRGEFQEQQFNNLYIQRHEDVSILFADIKGFTGLSFIFMYDYDYISAWLWMYVCDINREYLWMNVGKYYEKRQGWFIFQCLKDISMSKR